MEKKKRKECGGKGPDCRLCSATKEKSAAPKLYWVEEENGLR